MNKKRKLKLLDEIRDKGYPDYQGFIYPEFDEGYIGIEGYQDHSGKPKLVRKKSLNCSDRS